MQIRYCESWQRRTRFEAVAPDWTRNKAQMQRGAQPLRRCLGAWRSISSNKIGSRLIRQSQRATSKATGLFQLLTLTFQNERADRFGVVRVRCGAFLLLRSFTGAVGILKELRGIMTRWTNHPHALRKDRGLDRAYPVAIQPHTLQP